MRNELQFVLDSLKAMPSERLPELLGELEVIRATAMMRLSTPVPGAQPDCLLGVAEAAERLGVSEQYLYRHHAKYPFARREGRKLLFSSNGIDVYIGHRNSKQHFKSS